MRYVLMLLFIINTAVIGWAAVFVTHVIKSNTPVTLLQADYYEVNGEKKPGKNEFAIINVKDKKVAKLQWTNGKLDFVDGGIPMTETARQFLILTANTYNQMMLGEKQGSPVPATLPAHPGTERR